jgi:hypothetical protein
MSEELEPKDDAGQTKEPEPSKPFFHKNGMGQPILRIKEGESLEEAVARLRKEGWIIPDLGQLAEKQDATGSFFVLK